MSKRDTMLNRKIEKLIKEDKENTILIKNLEQRNESLAAEVITLQEKDDYKQFKINQLEKLLQHKREKIEEQKDKMDKMQDTWKLQATLLVVAYILFVILMCMVMI